MPRRVITAHAAHRYVERIDPTASFEEAMRRLTHALNTSSRSGERTRMGDVYHVTESLRLVVREERRLHSVMTVLPRESEVAPSDEEMDLAVELNRAMEESRKTDKDRLGGKQRVSLQELRALKAEERNRKLKEALAEASRMFDSTSATLRERAATAEESLERTRSAVRLLLSFALVNEASHGDAAAALDVVRSRAPELLTVELLSVEAHALGGRACILFREEDPTR